jgi:uncharacterized repeat protein (TIGR01451 family)
MRSDRRGRVHARRIPATFARPFVAALVLSLCGGIASRAGTGPAVFINEIHYDNAGTDTGEFVEIAGPAGTNLSGYSIVLYNGAGGAVYDTDALSGTIPDQQNGFGTVVLTYPANGIQNGAPDGIALVQGTTVIQFLSYEGTFTAVGGPAGGMLSTDIGVLEGGSDPIGHTLQLRGTGTTYDDFTWAPPGAGTANAVNTDQTFGDTPATPVLSVNDVSVAEGNAGTATATFTVSLSAAAGPGGVSFDVATQDGTATAGSGDYDERTLVAQTIPEGANSFAFAVTVHGDTAVEPDETFQVNVTNVVGADLGDGQGAGTILNDDSPPVTTDVIINEVDSDTPGADAAEFVELYDGGAGNTSLSGLVVVLFNGSNDLSYRAIDLDGRATDAAGYFTIGNAAVPGVDLIVPGDTLQNGQDAVALYAANGSDFPNNTPVTVTNLVDAVVYDTDDADDPGLLILLNPGEPQVNENGGGSGTTQSSQRCPNGEGGARNTSTYLQRNPSPDGANDCPAPPVVATIPEIQGPGAVSPFAGVAVTTTGIVTAVKQDFLSGAYQRVGFFLQTPAPDADPNTSEGLFVFTNAPPPVSVGDEVRVTGQAAEFFQLTQVASSPGNVVVLTTGHPLPAPVTLTPAMLSPGGPKDQLERFEGMRVHADVLRSVAPTNAFAETFTVFDGVARPMREPGIEISQPVPPDPTSGTPDCCIPRWDENPERVMIDSDGVAGTGVISVTSNVTFSGVTGPLDFTFSNYKILPETAPATSPNMSAVPVPVPEPDEFTVAGFNIENFVGDATQRRKAALAIAQVLHYPDVLGHVEILSEAALQTLADQVNADAVAAGLPDPGYVARLIAVPPPATQNVGFLVKTSRVQIDSVTQELVGETFINPNTGLPETLHDRPPLVLRATFRPSGPNPRAVIVIVNHLRSFIDIELVGGEGPRVRAKRTAQAEAVARLLQSLQTGNPGTPVISIGDYNAYQFNDGYTDPLSILKGTPTPDDQIVVDASPDLVNPDFVNLTDGLPAEEQYSFIFEGTPQAIDHMLVNTAGLPFVRRYAVGRNNTDFPEGAGSVFESDPTRPERNSDHDMPVAYFLFPAIADLEVSKTASPGTVTAGANVTYSITVTNAGPAPAQDVVVADNLPAGTAFDSCAATGGGVCGGTGNNRTVTFGALPAGASATVTLVATVGCGLGNVVSNTAIVSSATQETDPLDNVATVTIDVSDPGPTIEAPAPVTVPTGPDAATCAAFVSDGALGTPTAVDNCPGVTIARTGVPAGNIFPVGTTSVTYTATDSAGHTATATQTVTVLDQTRARVTASLTPVGRIHKKEGTFRVGFTTTDNCDPTLSVVAVMAIPDGADGFHVRPRRYDDDDEDDDDDSDGDGKIVIDYDRRLITLRGDVGAMRARLAQILVDDGAAVAQSQLVRLVRRGDDDDHHGHGWPRTRQKFTFVYRDGLLIREKAPTLVLKVTATDDSGNVGTATAVPVFPRR